MYIQSSVGLEPVFPIIIIIIIIIILLLLLLLIIIITIIIILIIIIIIIKALVFLTMDRVQISKNYSVTTGRQFTFNH